ncbi:MAG: acetyltransferase [Alcaligenaceae bacterium]|nr:acetyltransferase [Alcaligenaceae bacterium]
MNKLAIYGAGGHGKVIADTAELLGWQTIHFFDENHSNYSQHESWEVLGGFFELCEKLDDYEGVIVAIGNNKIRYAKYSQLKSLGGQLVSLIHPQSIVSRKAKIGTGSVVFAGAVVNAFTRIGEASIINTSASIDHDCDLGNAVHICPGTNLAGNVTVGDFSWIGIGSSVIQQIDITNDVFVGAGSVVVDNIERSGKYFGTPAKLVED